MTVSSIGPVLTRGQVAQAAVSTLTTWLETFAAEVERQAGLGLGDLPRPPAPESVHGALDFTAWRKDLTPEILVLAEPYGEAELFGDGMFSQWYELQIGAIVVTDDEDTSTRIADLYGAVITATLAGNGDLGGLAERTRLAVMSRTEFEDPTVRGVQRSITVFRVLIEAAVSEITRPPVPVPDGQLPPAPVEASATSFTFTAVPDSQPIT